MTFDDACLQRDQSDGFFTALCNGLANAFPTTRRRYRRAGLGCIKAGWQGYFVAPHSCRHPRRNRTSRARELRSAVIGQTTEPASAVMKSRLRTQPSTDNDSSLAE